eukprot:7385103-Prymnesium_polylepis.1
MSRRLPNACAGATTCDDTSARGFVLAHHLGRHDRLSIYGGERLSESIGGADNPGEQGLRGRLLVAPTSSLALLGEAGCMNAGRADWRHVPCVGEQGGWLAHSLLRMRKRRGVRHVAFQRSLLDGRPMAD